MSSSATAKQPFANLYFFPLAAAYAAVVLPWSVLAQLGLAAVPPGLQGPLGHAHEMLFGFALAVVAGYVLGPQPKRLILAILGLWIAARVAFLGWPATWLSAGFNTLFVALLAYRVVPRFARTAKKWRNKTVAPVLLGLCLVAALFHFLSLADRLGPLHGLLLEAVLLLSILMFFMGGRMIAPAVAGHLLKQKRDLDARVQPRLEGAVLICMGAVLVLNSLPLTFLRPIVGGLLLISAGLTLARALRWQVWHCLDRPDLLALILGYVWLAAGWLLVGLAFMVQLLPISAALHALTVGALGTLTFTVMARTRLHRSLKDPNAYPTIYLTVGLFSIAALARLAAGTLASPVPFHTAAALCWSLAYLILLFFLTRLTAREPVRNALNTGVERPDKPMR